MHAMLFAHGLRVEPDGHTVIFDGVCLLPPWANAGWNPDVSVLYLDAPGSQERRFSRIAEIQPTNAGCVVTVRQPYRPGVANGPWAIGGKRWDAYRDGDRPSV